MAKPSHSSDQEFDRGGLLFIVQHLGVRQSGGIVDGHMDFLLGRSNRAAKAPIASDSVIVAIKPG
jgi:hypothetical protein